MTKVGQHNRIDTVVDRVCASVGMNKVAGPGMGTTKSQNQSSLLIGSQNGDSGTANSTMTIEFVSVEGGSVVWRHIDLADWNVNFT